ncbi:MAG TPA: rhomboid family intramembrane serine protease [Proteobacteria bacterium]|nr:rhomboid family intramembrane serine protease [Pseudomonadota bacterium]
MLLPIGDSPNPENYTPWATWLLIAANFAVYIFISYPLTQQPANLYDPALQEYLRFLTPRLPHNLPLTAMLQRISAYEVFVFANGYKAGAPQLEDLFFSLFLHGSFLHLAGNMLFLWIYGDNVEHRLGHLPYFLLYLFCGIAATLFFSIFTQTSMTPLIGASGAISGVLGFYFIFFPRNQIKVFLALFPFFFNVVRLPARLVLGFYLLVDNVLPFLMASSGGVAYGAHIGGFISGLAGALIWNRKWKMHAYQDFRKSREKTFPLPFERLREALALQDRDSAMTVLPLLAPSDLNSLNAQETSLLASWVRQDGHQQSADLLLRSFVKTHAGSSDLALIFLDLGKIRFAAGELTAAAYYLHEALESATDPKTANTAHQLLAEIEHLQNR